MGKKYLICVIVLLSCFSYTVTFAGNYEKSCKDITITQSGVLEANCGTVEAFGWHNVSLDLNKYIGYQDEKLDWGGKNFADTCKNIQIESGGSILWATCSGGKYSSHTTWMQINLKISYRNGLMGLGARLSYDD